MFSLKLPLICPGHSESIFKSQTSTKERINVAIPIITIASMNNDDNHNKDESDDYDD